MVLQLGQSISPLTAPLFSAPPVAASKPPEAEVNEAATTAAVFSSSLPAQRQHWAHSLITELYSVDQLSKHVKRMLAYVTTKFNEIFRPDSSFTYAEVPLSRESEELLEEAGRKTLILDLDETLVHSCYNDPETQDNIGCGMVPAEAVADYTIDIEVEDMEVTFHVFKRPHVDEFLDFVAKWYDLVIYTASLEAYATKVVDMLDAGRGILDRRFYRQHCRSSTNLISKDLSLVNRDMRRVFIIDNSPNAYRDFQANAIPILTWYYDPDDNELLKLLPFLDALRFTKDVRTILSRRSRS